MNKLPVKLILYFLLIMSLQAAPLYASYAAAAGEPPAPIGRLKYASPETVKPNTDIILLIKRLPAYEQFFEHYMQPVTQSLRAMLGAFAQVDMAKLVKTPVDSPEMKGKKIPILMYHAIADKPWTSNTNLFVRPAEMEAQLKYLSENGYQTITFEDLDYIGSYTKPIILTFDDGYRDNYDVLFPLLKKYNQKATIFMISNAVWDREFCSAEELKEMANSGYVSIQSHTVNHYNLTSLKNDTLQYELTESITAIEDITGKPVIALCYPIGHNNAAVRAAAAEHYRYATTMNSGKFTCGEDLMSMKRIYISRGMSVSSFAAKIS